MRSRGGVTLKEYVGGAVQNNLAQIVAELAQSEDPIPLLNGRGTIEIPGGI